MPTHSELALLCPVCREPLRFVPGEADGPASLRCAAGHHFDAAKQGYFNFLVGKGTVFEADSAAMVNARYDFLTSGHFDALADAVAAALAPALTGDRPLILDSGTGTGHYLRRVMDTMPASVGLRALGMDISKFAVRRAARLNPEALNLVADVWQPLPIADHSVDAIMVIFAPRNAAGFARALKPGGLLVVVTPRPGHLSEIAAAAGMLAIEQGKDDRLVGQMAGHFQRWSSVDLDVAMDLTIQEVADLAFMGPAGHHLDRASLRASLHRTALDRTALAGTSSAGASVAGTSATPEGTTRVTAHFKLTTFRPLPG